MPLMPALQAAVERAVNADFDAVELLTTPIEWPGTHHVHVAVLDSSFNPPTTAHFALASSIFPPPTELSEGRSTELLSDPGHYSARLLLYSARNADKSMKPGDASPSQRAEMMIRQASAVQANISQPVAVGLLSAPTFAVKAQTLTRAMRDRFGAHFSLSFLVGTDTLERIFDEKYYPQGMGVALEILFSQSWLVCAPRGKGADDRYAEEALLRRPGIREWIEKGKVRMLPNDTCGDISSTRVREAIRRGEGVQGLTGMCEPSVAEYIVEQGLYK